MMEINKKYNKEIKQGEQYSCDIVVIMGQFCSIEDVAKLICTDFRDFLRNTFAHSEFNLSFQD